MSLYSLKCLADVISGKWTYDSCFYDLESYSETLYPLRERLEKNPEKQFAVAVDFHF
jgi:hypothetical protein